MINISVHDILNNSLDRLSVPGKVELIEDNLVLDTITSGSVKECPRSLLDSFIELAGSDSETIRIFACKYGVLGLCKDHNLPFCHNLTFIYNGWINPDRSCRRSGVESVETWRNWARKFRATLRIVSKLSNRQPGDRGDWDLVLQDVDFTGESFFWDDKEEFNILMEKELMQCLINQYLKLGGIRLRFYLLGNEDEEIPRPRLTVESPAISLFSVLVLQLVSKISTCVFKEEIDCDLELAS